MAQLFIRALGSLQLTLDGNPLTGFDSDKVRGLLVYLVVESNRSHTREKLAGLFWPEYSERSARTNLRGALANLRKVIGDHESADPFLTITRQTIQFNQESDHGLDVADFQNLLEEKSDQRSHIDSLEESVDMYKGRFLEGFSIPDSNPIEDWVLINREALQLQMSGAIHQLAVYYESQDIFDRAEALARRQVEIDPYQEEAHRQVMRILARKGQRSDALAQYTICQTILADELGVEPDKETTVLYERIRAGEISKEVSDVRMRAVRGYELRELLGTGQFGVVYRAFQPVIMRDVAVKVILPQFADQLDFIRRFEAEAQIVARLEHPHIVPLYDFWREPEGAYLVMRWLKGGNLSTDLERGPWNPESAMRLVDQIAAALTVAHRQGVVHRDVKPANILLDEDGNAYLSDFGIATLTGLAEFMNTAALKSLNEESSGSLGYLSPELAQKKHVGVQTDIYSFGVVMYELLIGEHPFPDAYGSDLINMHLHESIPLVHPRNPEYSPEVDAVIQRATAKDPRDRYPDPLTLAEDFRLAIKPGVHDVSGFLGTLEEIQNPYKGLRPFQEVDADDFFGRESLVEQLLMRMGERDIAGRFLAVVGPSGSGKSSVVKAGLIPALRKDALPGSGNWLVSAMTPGKHPLEELETALLKVAITPPSSLLEQLKDDSRGLARAVRRSLPTEGGEDDQVEMILVVDQFEEVFTLTEDEAERVQFIDLLCSAVADPGSRLWVVITLRADFYDRPLLYPEFGRLLHTHMETVMPLSDEELSQAIVGPAERVDLSIEPGLVAAIQSDISDQPGFLPLLQYALTESFENREDNELTLAAYQKSGGVTGALARRAETLYEGLDKEEQEITRQVFLRLVTLGEGIEDTRRRMMLAELITLGDGRETVERILEIFGQYRLLTFDHDRESRAPTVELAHEALLREWNRLRDWIDASRDDLRMHQRLSTASAEWRQSDREPSYLLQGSRLMQFEVWAAETDLVLAESDQKFLNTGLEARRVSEASEAARLERERTLEKRSRNFLRILAAVLLVATLGASSLAFLAYRSQRQAETEAKARATQQYIAENQARIAKSRELASAAISNLDVDPERSVLLALEAIDQTYSVEQTVLPEAEVALHKAVQEMRILFSVPSAGGVAFSPDGTLIAATNLDGGVSIRDSETGMALLNISDPDRDVNNLAFSPDGRRLITTMDDRAVIWDTETGNMLLTLSGHEAPLITPAFSLDGLMVATTSFDGTARVWDASTGEEILVLQHEGLTSGPEFSPDGTLLAVADHGASVARVWDIVTGEEILSLVGHGEDVNEADFSPDGTRLLTAGSDKTAKVWDAETGDELLTLFGHTGWVFATDFSPNGKLAATGSQDGTARIWDANTGQELLILAGHAGGISNLAISPDGKRLITGGDDGTARVWDISPKGSREWLTLAGHTELAFGVDYSPDGQRLATTSWDGTTKVWDMVSGNELDTLKGSDAKAAGVSFSPDGKRIATTSYDGTASVWDQSSEEKLLYLESHTDFIYRVDYSPDGKQLATASEDGTAIVWDAITGEIVSTLSGHSDQGLWDVSYSPDGKRLATSGDDGTVKIFDTGSGVELLSLTGHFDWVTGIDFSPDGQWLASASFDTTAIVWDTTNGEVLFTLTGHTAPLWDVAFSPDGKNLASSDFGGTLKLWDLTASAAAGSGVEMLSLDGYDLGPDIAFSPDGRYLAVTHADGTVRILVLPIEELVVLAQERLTRDFSLEECQQYLHLEACPAEP